MMGEHLRVERAARPVGRRAGAAGRVPVASASDGPAGAAAGASARGRMQAEAAVLGDQLQRAIHGRPERLERRRHLQRAEVVQLTRLALDHLAELDASTHQPPSDGRQDRASSCSVSQSDSSCSSSSSASRSACVHSASFTARFPPTAQAERQCAYQPPCPLPLPVQMRRFVRRPRPVRGTRPALDANAGSCSRSKERREGSPNYGNRRTICQDFLVSSPRLSRVRSGRLVRPQTC